MEGEQEAERRPSYAGGLGGSEMELAQPQEAVRFEKTKCDIHQSQMLMPGMRDSGVYQPFP